MKRTLIFAHRVTLELLRDPLSWIFALGFPIVMLFVMTLVNQSIPAEAAMTIFQLPSLVPAVWVFGMTFLMLFGAQLMSKDRSEAFLIRLYLSPITAPDFLMGYLLPITVLGILQGIITCLTGSVIGLFTGESISVPGAALTFLLSLPSLILFISMGMLFGVLLSERAAPGISSAVISAASLLGGIWMDVDAMGGAWLKICRALPFYHAVKLARAGVLADMNGVPLSLGVVSVYAVSVFALAAVLFTRQKRK